MTASPSPRKPLGVQPTDSADTSGTLLMSAADVGREIRLSIRSVRRMDSSGALPRPIRLSSGACRWRRSDVVAWIAAGCPRRGET